MKKRTAILCLLAAALSAAPLTSCGTGGTGADTASAAPTDSAQTDAPTADTASLFEQMEAVDYSGYALNIYLQNGDDRQIDIVTEGEETGDVMNDIVYARNRAIEEKYNITINGTYDSNEVLLDVLRSQVQGGLNDFDLYFTNSYAAALAPDGYLYKLNDLPNVDLSGAWWDQASISGLSVGGDVFLVTGDISPTSLLTSSCLVFNKTLLQNQDMEYPYDLAAEGKWTLDKLTEMTKGLTADLNGDGNFTLNDDVFGFSSWCADSPFSLFYGAGCMQSEKDANDIPYVAYDLDKITAVYDMMYQLIIEQDSYFVTDAALYPTTYECFSNGGAYFCEITLQKIGLFLRDMEDDYGILPIPKWDEAQEGYFSCVNAAGGLIAVPSNTADPARTGMLLEALAVGAYDMISPSLYNVITKSRNVRDEESAEMVSLITRNRVFDPVYINLCTGYGTIQGQLVSGKEEIASAIEKTRKQTEDSLQKIVDAFADNQ